MFNDLWILIVFWGVWIIIPVIFDGVLTLIYMHTIIFHDYYLAVFKKKNKKSSTDPVQLPRVSIIIPTYNEEENINECLDYLKRQDYPHTKMEILVVDNGSTDKTSEIVKAHMQEIWHIKHNGSESENVGRIKIEGETDRPKGFAGVLRLLIRSEKSKANALNTGIRLSNGEIIINIDCRSFLASNAVSMMVKKFLDEPECGAATGNVEIDWQMIYQRTPDGQYILDDQGKYRSRTLSWKENFLGRSQFLEYLTSFRLGREFQDITGSMYTFSGAFSAFRREVLLKSALYSSRTVAEDTDMTLNLQGQSVRLGFAKNAKALLKPVISFEKFYAQRVRWHRGQIEVVGLHLDWYGDFSKGFWRAFWHSILLLVDHTFGFPRIIWTFLLPLFFLFGYSMTLIIKAILLMYAFYVFIDFINALNCYRVSDQATRKKIRTTIHYCLVTPFFRLMTFYFRFGGYLDVLKEKQVWTTPYSPVRSTKTFLGRTYNSYNRLSQNKFGKFLNLPPAPKLEYEEKISEIDSYGADTKSSEPVLERVTLPKKEIKE